MTTSPRASLIASFTQRYALLAIRLGSLVILSRLIPPDEVGRFVAASSILAIGQAFADFGASQYIIQTRHLTPETERTAFGMSILSATVAIAIILGSVLFAPSHILPADLRTATACLALALVFYPLTVVASGVLQRGMHFGALASSSILAALASTFLSVVLALAGLGFMSLVWGAVAEQAIAAALLTRRTRLCRPSLKEWRALIGFGWMWTAIGGLRQASDAALRLGVGATLGFNAVGILTRSQSLILLFDRLILDATGPVLLPALAGRIRDERDIGAIHTRLLACLTAIAWPFFALLALLADPLVRVLLGPQWLDAVAPARLLCLGGLFLPFSGLTLQYFLALGMLKTYLPYHALTQLLKCLAVVLASRISLEAAALALVLEPALKGLCAQRLLARHLTPSWQRGRKPLVTSALAALAATLTAQLALHLLGDKANAVVMLIAAALAALPAWLLALWLGRHPLLAEMHHAMKHLLERLCGTCDGTQPFSPSKHNRTNTQPHKSARQETLTRE